MANRRLYQGCVIITQLMLLNVLFVATAWPLVTAPAALLAVFAAFKVMVEPEAEPTFGQVVRRWGHAWASDVRSTLVMTALAALIGLNLYLVLQWGGGSVTRPGFLVPAIFLADWWLTTAMVATWYAMPPLALMRTGFFLALANLHRGVPFVVIGALLLWFELKSPFALVALGVVLPLFAFFWANARPVRDLRHLLEHDDEAELDPVRA